MLILLPAAAHAGLAGDLDWARRTGCGFAAPAGPLRESPVLDAAVRRVASGASLHAALAAAGYTARQSSAVHLSGNVGDGAVAHTLASSYCATLRDAHWREFGGWRRGSDVWLLLADPAPLPRAADAAAMSRLILDVVNEARASGHRCGRRYFGPAPPLVLDARLGAAALEHSRDMASHELFEHRGHDGSTPAQRVRRAGYGPYRVVGENIAAGAMTGLEVARGWLDSPEHCENIMDPRFVQIGIGYAVAPAGDYRVYWTQVFAAPAQHAARGH